MPRIQVPSFISPAPAPGTEDGRAIVAWVMEAFAAEGRARQEFETIKLQASNAEPIRPREGMTAFADGIGWNPGAGKGFYNYVNGAWISSGGGGNLSQNSQITDYTLVGGDAGKMIYHPGTDNNPRTWTIPSNSSVNYAIGTAITFINRINTITIAIASDTMIFSPSGVTGPRSLAADGIATIIKVELTVWYIAGNGLT